MALTFEISSIPRFFDSYCFCHSLFIQCPIVYFRWARGANAIPRRTPAAVLGQIGRSAYVAPLASRSHAVRDGQGRNRTYGVSNVTDLQSAAIAAMHTCPNAFPVCKKLPETNESYCEPQIAGTQYRQRALPARHWYPWRESNPQCAGS